MKKLFSLLALLISVNLSAQTFKVPKKTTTVTTTTTTSVITYDADSIVVLPDTNAIIALKCSTATVVREDKGIYVDNINTRLQNGYTPNDMTVLNLLFDPTQRHANNQTNFNIAPCYSMHKVFPSTNLKKLFGDWISLRHKADKTFRVGCVNSFESAFLYNQSQTDTTRRIDYLYYELEYWNTVDPVTGLYSPTLALAEFNRIKAQMPIDSIKYYGKFGIKGIFFYNGHFKDGYKETAPEWFARNKVTLHGYNTDPSQIYVKDRLLALDRYGAKKHEFLPSSESVFWGPKIRQIGYDSCLVLQKKAFNNLGLINYKWNNSLLFDVEHYLYWSFPASLTSRSSFVIPIPQYPTNPNHLKEVE